jgi:hypothetical protein
MKYDMSLEGLQEVFSEATKDGGPDESDATATWGCVIATALLAITERLEEIAVAMKIGGNVRE